MTVKPLLNMAVGLLVMVLAACAPVSRGGDMSPAIEAAMTPADVAPSPAPVLPPPEIRSALIPDIEPRLMVPDHAELERFDIAASQVEAREFFMGLVTGSSVNMVVHPQVGGLITLHLKNTTIDEVLRIVHNVYGYPYVKTGQVYQIMPAGLQTRTYQVNYLNLVRRGTSQTRISSGQVSQGESSGEQRRGSDGTVSGSRIDTESVTDFWSELTLAIEGLVGREDGRKVVVQPQAGVVVVVAMPEEQRQVGDYLRLIQQNMQRQVVIEAKIIEVTLADGFQSGINWAALATTGSGRGVLIGQTGDGTSLAPGIRDSGFVIRNSEARVPFVQEFASEAFGGAFSMALNFKDFQGFIEILESQGDVQVLSSPRISTVNNQKAIIKVGSDEFFVTDISSDTTTGTTTSSSTDVTLTPFFSGIALDVTPQIDENGGIILHIHPTVSEVVDQQKKISLFGVDQVLPLAFSTVRESDSVVRAESGQLVVIGGLMQEKVTDNRTGIPVLGRLPGIGGLFRHTKTSTSKSELVILLRPHVIRTADDWNRDLDRSRERVRQLIPHQQQGW